MSLDAPDDITFVDRETGADIEGKKPQITVRQAEALLKRLVADGLAERTRLESGRWRYTLTESGRAAAKRAYERDQLAR